MFVGHLPPLFLFFFLPKYYLGLKFIEVNQCVSQLSEYVE